MNDSTTKKYVVTLSHNAYLPPLNILGMDKDTIKAEKGKVSSDFQSRQRKQPNHVSVTHEELAARIQEGYCLRGALLHPMNDSNTDINKDGRKSYNTEKAFIQQGAILLDFDNKAEPPCPELTTAEGIRDMINHKVGANVVSVVAESWTSSPSLRKWHVILLLDEPCSDFSKVKSVIKYLVDTVFKGLADTACKDPARYVLGSAHHMIVKPFNGELDIELLYQKAIEYSAPKKDKAHNYTVAQGSNDTDMTPERLADIILGSHCDFGADGYAGFRNTATALYHIAHVPSEVISEWGASYDGTAQDPRTWEHMNRDNTFSFKTLIWAAKKLNPAAFNAYKVELHAEYRPHRPKTEPIPEQYKHLFNDDGELLTDKLTTDDIVNCEQLYTRVYTLESPAEITAYIMKIKQAAKALGLAGDFEKRIAPYKAEALRNLKSNARVAHRKLTGQTARDLRDFPYIIDHENEQGDIYYTVSCPLLAEHIRQNCHYIIIHDRFSDHDRMFWYKDGVYNPITDSILQGYIKAYITKFDLAILKMRDVLEVMKDLKTDMRFVDESKLNADEDIINFKNGLYSISENTLKPHTPDVYSTIQIPCDYSPKNTYCPVFTQYLYDIADDDVNKANLLLEYMAACISNIKGYRMKKALFMYGKGNTGKSQAKALTEMLIGAENCAAGDLSDLEERFGTSSLYNKRLYGSGDMSFVGVKELKIFKNVTGGDEFFLEFKGKNAIRYKYNGLLWFCTNELPSFGGDRGEWVYDRIIPLECKMVIPKAKQDKRILEKMFAEREAIINGQLIPALQKLIDRNYCFDIPDNVLNDLEAYKDKNSPVRTFYKECCVMRDKQYSDGVTLQALYNTFRSWYADNFGRSCILSRKNFKKELAEILGMPNPDSLDVRRNDGIYCPLTLSGEARKSYNLA